MGNTRKAHVELPAGHTWKTAITVGPHAWVGDVGADAGGQDLGPDPEEMLLAAWGTCTAMTVQMYAQRKEWPLEKIAVDLERIPRSAGKPEQLIRTITLYGSLSEEQRARLGEIAEKCPVHRTLTHNPEIETKLTEAVP